MPKIPFFRLALAAAFCGLVVGFPTARADDPPKPAPSPDNTFYV